MSRHKRKRESGDSFDLFLDTITNTFGGVLLIALLIVLLIREPTDNGPEDTHAGPTEDIQVVESEISSLEAEKTALKSSIKVLEQFETDFKNDEVKSLASQLKELLPKQLELERVELSLSNDVKQVAADIKNAKVNELELAEKVSENSAELIRLSDELKNEKSLRTRTMTLPKERRTSKSEVPVVVEDDQLFFLEANSGGFGFHLNENHFEECSAAGADVFADSKYVRTRAGQGVPLLDKQIKNAIARHSASRDYFAFVVRTDSFDSFSKVRDACVRSGFEYRLIPTDDIISESGGINPKTQ